MASDPQNLNIHLIAAMLNGAYPPSTQTSSSAHTGGSPGGSGGGAGGGGGSGRKRTPSPPRPPAEVDPGPRLVWRGGKKVLKYANPGTRRKGRKSTVGWHNIPTPIIRRILDYYLLDYDETLLPVFQRIKTSKADSIPDVPRMLNRRIGMDALRLVSPGWRNGVDSHLFWPEYNLAINNIPESRRPDVVYVQHDLAHRTLRPTGFTNVSHRGAALHDTRFICIICRLDRPESTSPFKSNKKAATIHMGRIIVCKGHQQNYCDVCLKVDPACRMDQEGNTQFFEDDVELKFVHGWDTDPHGITRSRCQFCAQCRLAGLEFQIKRVLGDLCRRGGELRGMEILGDFSTLNKAATDYVDFGVGTAVGATAPILDEMWLRTQGSWEDLQEIALQLQAQEEIVKRRIFKTGKGETVRELQVRRAQLAKLFGQREMDEDWVVRDTHEWEAFWAGQQRRAMASHGVLSVNDYDDEDEEESEEEVDDGVVSLRWWKKLRHGAIYDFVNDRIKHGLWVSPEDEIAQLAAPGETPLHCPMRTLAKTAIHPFDDPQNDFPDFRPEDVMGEDTYGWINLSARRIAFLPTPRLAQQLEDVFAERLRLMLVKPLNEIVHAIEAESSSEDDAERRCSLIDIDRVMRILHKRESWLVRGLVDDNYLSEGGSQSALDVEMEDEEEEEEFEEVTQAESGSAGRLGQRMEGMEGEADTEQGTTPRIEFVMDEHPASDYGIQEVDSSPSVLGGTTSETFGAITARLDDAVDATIHGARETTNETTTSTTNMTTASTSSLGKRKEAPDDNNNETKERKSVPHLNEPRGSVGDSSRSPIQYGSSSPALDTPDGESRKGSSDTSSGPLLLTPNDDTHIIPPDIELKEPLEVVPSSSTTGSELASPITSRSPSPREYVSGPLKVRRREKPKLYHTALYKIPWIPSVPVEQLGPRTKEILKEAWWAARAKLRVCRCTVCQRRRKMDAWTELEDGRRLDAI